MSEDKDALADYIDDGQGAAALSATQDWIRANARPEANDGRSTTRTYFDSRDAPGHYPPWQKHLDPDDRRSWATLATWQDGAQSDISRGGQNWWADKQRWVDVFGDQLHATQYHRDETKRVVEELSVEPDDEDEERAMMVYSARRISTELVIIGILSLYIDSDINDFENRTLARDETKALLDDLESDVSEYETVRSLLRSEHGDILFPE